MIKKATGQACPECNEDLGNPKYGLLQCPQCLSKLAFTHQGMLVRNTERPKEAGKVSGVVTKRWRKQGPQPLLPKRICIGCAQEIPNPLTCRTGSIISGLAFKNLTVDRRTPVIAVVTTWERSYVIGGNYYTKTIPIGFFTRNKGYLCDGCSTCITQIRDSKGNLHPLVKIDREDTSSQTKLPSYERIPGSMPNREQEFRGDQPAVTFNRRSLQRDHWLDVGRRK